MTQQYLEQGDMIERATLATRREMHYATQARQVTRTG